MNCTIPVANLKLLGKGIQILAKIGEELYIDVKKESLIFRAINSNKTVFSSFELFNSFFTSFNINDSDTEEENISQLACKIQMKAILAIFKPLHKDKNLHFCQIELPYETNVLKFKLRYKYEAEVIHKVPLLDLDSWNVSYHKDSPVNQIIASGQCCSQVLSNFQLNDADISLEVLEHKVIMRNYDLGEVNSLKSIRSQYVLNAIEFNRFKIGQITNITFSLKPFRAAVHFSEQFNVNLALNFEKAGKPAVLVIKSTTFEIDVVLATVSGDGSTQSSIGTSIPSLPRKPINVENEAGNLTIQDKEVLENIDWDVDMDKVADKNPIGLSSNSIFGNTDKNKNSQKKNKSSEEITSPKSKLIKTVFARCFENTIREEDIDYGEVLVPCSDVESD